MDLCGTLLCNTLYLHSGVLHEFAIYKLYWEIWTICHYNSYILYCIRYYNMCNVLNDIVKTLLYYNYTLQYYTMLFCINLYAGLYSTVLYYAIQFLHFSVFY